eukprot:Blabericola_migrator_1__5037@NODE_260_length_10712_cov_94_884922_g218_i0_p6_GENE_NODE_260_length_10712_cov_94_884922_g218_i0NODE_260_length_10712_cov_94_884922_g218_i0_p6_ORF_typecomplete_len155_score23_06_NODE_260_length_10712_cov_94_884922_g218_i027443208
MASTLADSSRIQDCFVSHGKILEAQMLSLCQASGDCNMNTFLKSSVDKAGIVLLAVLLLPSTQLQLVDHFDTSINPESEVTLLLDLLQRLKTVKPQTTQERREAWRLGHTSQTPRPTTVTGFSNCSHFRFLISGLLWVKRIIFWTMPTMVFTFG